MQQHPNVPMGAQQGGQLPGYIAPAGWWEWVYSVFPPDHFAFLSRCLAKTIAVTAAGTNADTIEITAPGFAYSVRHDVWKTTGGAAPSFPTRLRVIEGSELGWIGDITAGTSYRIATSTSVVDYPFLAPRPVKKGTQISINVDNSLNAADAVTTDTQIWIVEVRRLSEPVQRDRNGLASYLGVAAPAIPG